MSSTVCVSKGVAIVASFYLGVAVVLSCRLVFCCGCCLSPVRLLWWLLLVPFSWLRVCFLFIFQKIRPKNDERNSDGVTSLTKAGEGSTRRECGCVLMCVSVMTWHHSRMCCKCRCVCTSSLPPFHISRRFVIFPTAQVPNYRASTNTE